MDRRSACVTNSHTVFKRAESPALQRPRAQRALRRVAGACGAGALAAAIVYAAALASAGFASAPLRGDGCAPLRVVDRFGQLVRELPAACGHRGRGAWV